MAAASTSSDKICELCNSNPSKYCCPKCGVLYCSLDCYKHEKHIDCSENFYRDCVNEELTGMQTDEESMNKMIKILTRMHKELSDNPDIDQLLLNELQDENIDSDDEELMGLKSRIEGIDLDDPDSIWGVLTEDEKNEFEALVSNGDLDKIVEPWEPWWMFRAEDKLIVDIGEGDNNSPEKAALEKCPPLKKVPKLSALTSVNPSPAIRFNICNVLASYAFIMRYFNGELDPFEAAHYLLTICGNLNLNTNFSDVDTAIKSVVQNCIKSDLIDTDETSLNIMRDDIILIFKGPSKTNTIYYCKAALSHLYNIFKNTKNISKLPQENTNTKTGSFSKKFPEHKSSHLPILEQTKVKSCMKKIEYYLSFVETYGL